MVGLVSPQPLVDAADGSEIPTILRNQGIRLGSQISGKALSASGTSLIGYGVAQRGTPTPIVRYESVTKKSVRAKGGTIQKGTRYLPPNSRPGAQNRQLHKHRYNRTASVPGSKAVKSGIALKGVGKALPVLAVGFIGYDLYHGRNPATNMDEVISAGGSMKTSPGEVWSFAKDKHSAYGESSLATIVFAAQVASTFWGVGSSVMPDLF